ncbi:hypothetical protein FB45DRAFT_1017366 [Roridomyces roridus]|uniref:Uncharacterized protein n=1 Tax=Roridomyces roridus TaxID=1738132 RepID=A0AAD7CIA3_9AGAR|nr:hypothetical protein FB45DRAFT_1017366 [Roridomyces roridus]
MQNFSFLGNIDQEEPDTLVLRHLRHLTHLGHFDVINWISAPRLETLCLATENLFAWCFISFLRQSSPPLQKLELRGHSPGDSFEDSGMTLIPTLVHLRGLNWDYMSVEDLLIFLAENPHHVPNLQTLQLDRIRGHSYTEMLTTLGDVLWVRRSMLKTVRLTTNPSHMPLPVDPTLFQQFLADGIHIHIGVDDGPNILSQ